MNDDPDFEVATSSTSSKTSNGSTPFLLRSACHEGHQFHELQFHSRISPSPSRSFHRRRRRKTKDSSTIDESEHDENMSNLKTGARRDLADDLNKVQRTSGWVAANLDRFAVPETTKRRSLKLKNSSNQNSGAIMNQQQQYHQETTTTSTTSYQRQNSYGFQYSPLKSDSPLSSKSSLSSTGSSRLQAFEGDAWKHSPRTGYTYVDSATYRQQWTPDREIPMPHMARRPLHDFDEHPNDSEFENRYVSYTSKSSNKTSARKYLDFSDTEDTMESYKKVEKQVSKSSTKFLMLWRHVFIYVMTIFQRSYDYCLKSPLISRKNSHKQKDIMDFTNHHPDAFGGVDNEVQLSKENHGVKFNKENYGLKELVSYIFEDYILSWIELILSCLVPLHISNISSEAVAFDNINDVDDVIEEKIYVKKITRHFTEIYNYNNDAGGSPVQESFSKNENNNGSLSKKIILSTMYFMSKMCSKLTRIMMTAPKALVLLLLPSILTNFPAEAENFNGMTPNIAANPNIQGPVIIQEMSLIRKITYNIHETYNWVSKGTSHAFQYLPDVKTPVRKSLAFISGIFFSMLLLFSPKFWWSKLPKISRKRTRKRKRKSRGPPTRFSARIRNLPIQFTGELPMRTRRVRVKPRIITDEIILPNESRTQRTKRLSRRFQAQVARFNPGIFLRTVSTIVNTLGYYQEEDMELRRSARLRGIAPEYDGLHFERRTRRSPNSSSNFDFMDEQPLEVIVKQPKQSILSKFLAWFGFYSESEIQRRQSLRLQGLDPEYEGLTWGTRKRKSKPRKKRISVKMLPFFQDYHDDDEVFFNYKEESAMDRFKSKVAEFNPGYLAMLFSSIFAQVGFYKEESLEINDEKLEVYNQTKSFEDLIEPTSEGLVSNIFGSLGYYSQNEIQRRQSLRLQGLDPEYEGLTWGKRQRKRKRIIPTIFQDPVEEEEDNADTSVSGGFFNHQEENPMERFKKRLARFNPGILRKILSKLISIFGFYKEESMEVILDLGSVDHTKSLEDLMEPSEEGIVSNAFKYIGYYSKDEIKRRQSLRLQGLEPQFEGLTWGKRKRTPKDPVPVLEESADETFFNVHEENAVDKFDSQVAQFNPGYLTRFFSTFVSIFGYYKEETVENLGVGHPETEITDDQNISSKSLEQLMKPSNEWILSRLLSYFGYYSQKEIKRRQSLRIQGLDPEYEGLTWGRVKRTRLLPFPSSIFGGSHHDSDVVFEYHEHEDGFLQRWTDYFLHKIGYLQFEDIPDESFEENVEQIDEEIEDFEDDGDLAMLGVVDDEHHSLNYVQIPQESFVNGQNQHEASFENSYSFEATEGYDEDPDNSIQVTKDDSCLGIILILAIPLLLLLSLAILDPKNALIQGLISYSSSSEDYLSAILTTLTTIYQSIWSIPKWLWTFSFDIIFETGSVLLLGLAKLPNVAVELFFDTCYSLVYLYGTLETVFGGLSIPSMIVDDHANVISHHQINYDDLVKKILENNQFQSALINLKQEGISNSEESMKKQLNEVIQNRFDVILANLEVNNQNSRQYQDAVVDSMNKEVGSVDNNLKLLKNEHEQVTSQLKLLTISLQNRVQENNDNAEAIKMLHEKILGLNNEISTLETLLKNCCKSYDSQLEFIKSFIEAQKDQFITKEQFQAEISTIIKLVHDNLINKSKESIEELIDFKLSSSSTSKTSSNLTMDSNNIMTKWDIEDMVKSALTIYGADKTGAFDFALETAGGSVVSTRCTQMYTDQLMSYSWLGVSIWLPLHIWGPTTNPRTAIQPGVMPGECWAFRGHEGYLVIKLSMPMKPTRFSMEHIPKSLSPNGKIDSAPKDFVVLGLQEEKDPNPEVLGRYTYDQNGEPLQFFNVEQNRSYTFKYVELHILNNHGQEKYTCLYRFRVHGSI